MACVHRARLPGGQPSSWPTTVQLAGHVHLGDWVFLGGLSGVHQFVRVGAHGMTAFQTGWRRTCRPSSPPAATRPRRSINAEGLRGAGASPPERITLIKQMYRLLYRTT